MIKYLVAVVIPIVLAVSSVNAAVPKLIRGTFQGSGYAQNTVGTLRGYDPIRIKVTKSGKVSGTAFVGNKLLNFKGKLSEVKQTTYFVEARIYGRMPDGTKWNGKITAPKLDPRGTGIMGTLKRKNGGYRGSMALLKM